MASYRKILNDTIKVLSFHQSIGLDTMPITKEIQDFLAHSPRIRHDTGFKKTPSEEGVAPSKATNKKQTATLSDIRTELGDCTRCSLHQNRTSIIFGSGNEAAKLLVVGEWPNNLDDRSGMIFSGPEGEMLEKMLTHVLNTKRDEVYLTSVIKCRVPDGTQGDVQQIRSCTPFILNQITVIQPQVICAMGPIAAQTLLKTNKPLIKLRGHFHDINSIPLMPTFHPSYLIKNPEMKKAAMHDLQLIKKKLDS